MFARLTNLSLHVSIELAKPECHGPVTTLANQRMLPCDKLSRLRALEMENLPLWFLILSLFLPRVSLIIAYFGDLLSPFNLSWLGATHHCRAHSPSFSTHHDFSGPRVFSLVGCSWHRNGVRLFGRWK